MDKDRQRIDTQKLLEHDKPSDSTVAVRKWVNLLKRPMDTGDLIRLVLKFRAHIKQPVHKFGNILRQRSPCRSDRIANKVRPSLVAAHVEKRVGDLSGALLENGIQVTDHIPVHRLISMVENPTERSEMITGFQRIIRIDLFAAIRGIGTGGK